MVGRQHSIPLAASTARVEVTAPGGASTVMEGERVTGRRAIAYTATDELGFYRVSVADESSQQLRRRPEADFAVNVDPRASDPTRAGPELLPAGDGADGAAAATTANQRRVELWHAVAAALLLLLLLESVLLVRGN